MKKIFMSLALVAMVFATVACNNTKKAAESVECVEEVVEEVADSTCCSEADSTCCSASDSTVVAE